MYKQMGVSFLTEEPEIPEEADDEEGGEEDETNKESTATTTTSSTTPTTSATTTTTQGTKRSGVSLFDSAEQAFLKDRNIDHASKIQMIEGYNELASELKEYLKGFAETGKTVTREVLQ
jgi:hypothetical protein